MTTVKKCANRKICTFPEDYSFKSGKCRPAAVGRTADFSKIVRYIDENVVGRNGTFLGPFGRRKGKLFCWIDMSVFNDANFGLRIIGTFALN